VCNFGKLNYFIGKRAADRGRAALYPDVDFCKDPGAVCSPEHPELKWIAGFQYWLNAVQPYDVRGASYLDTLHAWVDSGADPTDPSLADFASGVVNRGCHDAPFEGTGGFDPCGNGEIHGPIKRRKNFKKIWSVLLAAAPANSGSTAQATAMLGGTAAAASAVLAVAFVAVGVRRRPRKCSAAEHPRGEAGELVQVDIVASQPPPPLTAPPAPRAAATA